MKNTLIFLLIGIFYQAKAQTLIVANNNPGAATGTNVFTGATALQDALGGATDGDIIYVVPSSTSYGDITITVAVKIFGAGLKPDKDIGTRSEIDLINIEASNVRISGVLSLIDEVRLGYNSNGQNLDGIVIENSRIERVTMSATSTATVSNLLIRNNIISGTSIANAPTHILLRDKTSNTMITNNIFMEGNITGLMLGGHNLVYKHNVFSDNTPGSMFGLSSVNCLFEHNIFYNVWVASATDNCTFNYNLAFTPTDDAASVFNLVDNGTSGTGNISSVGGSNDPLFVNFPVGTQTWNDAYDVTLQAGSPALNVNGTDIGPSGGANPYTAEGNVLPLIQSVNLPDVISTGTDLPVTIKAKGN